MTHRLQALLAAAVLFAAAMPVVPPGGAAAKTVFRKVPAQAATFKTKSGYWVECRYSGLGEICETVYARAKNGKFRPVAAKAPRPVRQNGYYQVCYDGSNNAVICYWVYTRAKTGG